MTHGIWKAQWIGASADTTPVLYPIHLRFGFHTEFSQKSNTIKWVILDLGKTREINEVKLYPADLSAINAKGYLFPVRFRIDVSDNPGFEPFKTVIDATKKNVPNPGDKVWERSFQMVSARYIRLFITKLAQRNKNVYAASLAEFQVLHHGENSVLNAAVTASDTLINNNDNGGWNISYITDGSTQSSYIPKMEPSPPSPLLRKEFSISGKIKRAFLYISALGLYQATVNGKKVGDYILAPEWTDYRKRVQYQTYNVTPLLRDGKNVIGAMLADGWYVGPLMTNPQRGVYGINRRLIAQLEIEKEDGSWETICTDSSWKVYPNGPVRSASVYNGETYHGNLAIKGWATPGYDPAILLSKWNKATMDTTVHVLLSSQRDQPLRIISTIKPVQIIHPGKDVYIFDIGQNFAGWCQINLPEYEGQQIVLHHGEMLNKDSTLYTANLRGAGQVDSFSAPPSPVSFEPCFTYHGFRYVSVTGLHHAPGLSVVTGRVISSSNPQTGHFSCSDSLLNKLWENILWTQWSNTMGVPTDCPQRDERMGWMGDAQVFSQTAIFNMDMSGFYTKWMQDIRDGQLADGRFPDYAPALNTSFSYYNAPGWADAAVIIPWRLYLNYNDKRILEEQYTALKKYNAFIKKMNPDLI
ncbi:MAG: hypothetical protein EPN39_10195 [Chitinophagaceae bacterium]|nr:MAG: hypothetical protein EPN39_10195 [Chitinophagaceae bacterium]